MRPRSIAMLRSIAAPPLLGDAVPTTARNTYVLSWVIVGAVMPVMAIFAVLLPGIRLLAIVIGALLLGIALAQIAATVVGRSASVAPLLIVVGWLVLTWTAWVTGGLYSPSLYAQLVFVVLAETLRGWRWSLATLGFALATIALFAWAQARSLVPPSIVIFGPFQYAAVVAVYVCALFLLQSLLSAGMRAAHGRLETELADRGQLAARLRSVIDNAPIGAFVCELDDAEELQIVQTNECAAAIFGRDAHHVVGSIAERAFPILLGTPLVAELRSIAEVGGVFDGTGEFERGDGKPLTLDLHCFRIGPRTLGVFFKDVTEQRKAEAAIRHAAYHDELTSLPNRKLLFDRLGTAFLGARRRGNHIALLFIDLDNFKPINDELGHAFGDELLAAVAERLLSICRVSDTVARYGGDEFTLLLPDVETVRQAEQVAEKLIERFKAPFEIQGRCVTVTLSIGIALTTAEDANADSLLDRADMAMYEMKRTGRNGYRVFEQRWPGSRRAVPSSVAREAAG
jgi:diguanylate cyclase (GGDEF)-like protein